MLPPDILRSIISPRYLTVKEIISASTLCKSFRQLFATDRRYWIQIALSRLTSHPDRLEHRVLLEIKQDLHRFDAYMQKPEDNPECPAGTDPGRISEWLTSTSPYNGYELVLSNRNSLPRISQGLEFAAMYNYLDIIQIYVKVNHTNDWFDVDIWRACKAACKEGHVPIVDFLLVKVLFLEESRTGHFPNSPSERTISLLHAAAEKKRQSVVAYLLDSLDANPLLKQSVLEKIGDGGYIILQNVTDIFHYICSCANPTLARRLLIFLPPEPRECYKNLIQCVYTLIDVNCMDLFDEFVDRIHHIKPHSTEETLRRLLWKTKCNDQVLFSDKIRAKLVSLGYV